MVVRCRSNKPEEIEDKQLKKNFQEYANIVEVSIEIGKAYIVFGIILRRGTPWFLICEESTDDYPKPHSCAFFDVIDGCLPSDWVFSSSQSNLGSITFLPKQWANDPQYLERLINEDCRAIDHFNRLKVDYGSRFAGYLD